MTRRRSTFRDSVRRWESSVMDDLRTQFPHYFARTQPAVSKMSLGTLPMPLPTSDRFADKPSPSVGLLRGVWLFLVAVWRAL